jgi:hypothetical protein
MPGFFDRAAESSPVRHAWLGRRDPFTHRLQISSKLTIIEWLQLDHDAMLALCHPPWYAKERRQPVPRRMGIRRGKILLVSPPSPDSLALASARSSSGLCRSPARTSHVPWPSTPPERARDRTAPGSSASTWSLPAPPDPAPAHSDASARPSRPRPRLVLLSDTVDNLLSPKKRLF